jgi:hypothetical protein
VEGGDRAKVVSHTMSEAKGGPLPRAARQLVSAPQLRAAGRREQVLLGGLLLSIGGIWIGVPMLALMSGAPPPLPDLGPFGVCILLAVGAGQALWGLDLLLRRKTLTIDQNTVHVSVRGLMRERRWSEPLANYRGLRHCRERVRHRYGWRIVHRLQLAHPDPAKEVELFRAYGERRIEAARRQWAEWLGLPIWSGDDAVPRRPAREPERRAAAAGRRPDLLSPDGRAAGEAAGPA